MIFNNNKQISKYYLSFTYLIVCLIHVLSAQDQSYGQSSANVICALSLNCSSCLSRPQCAWCSSLINKSGKPRCDEYDSLLANGCPDVDIVNPASSVEIVKDNIQITSTQSPIQLHPQRIHLHIRKNDLQRFTIKYEQALDYPIDLYYLMDLTHSMKEHKEKLVELADSLAENMNNITKSFRLGFGSFIDKVVMPYANMVPSKLANPCTDRLQCAPPYGFRNHLPLNHNISQFSEEVESTPLSGNLDNAEGGFDAIMQAIVCRQHIQWNHLSRKIILFATDSIFHYAGDGKLGGIVKPNDGECHLSADGIYTESILQDYPSLGQIVKVVTDSKINIIFAVPEDSIDVYKQLSGHIPGSKASLLKDDSSNIVDIIRDNFQKIASKVELRDNSSDSVQIRYMSSCLGAYKSETNMCDNVGIGQTVEFDVELKVTECPAGGRETVVITPIGIDEYTVVELHVMCECECESQTVAKPNATECSAEGTYACGVCECNPNRLGKQCECDADHLSVDKGLINQCKSDLKSNILCSNRGNCVCGQCECHLRKDPTEVINGKYCECDTFSCNRDINGQTCGGLKKGYCCGGECHCESGWSGPICDCSTDNSTCVYDTQSGKVCSGHGECRCGNCLCDEGYYGQFCEDCANCEGRCNELQPCVECQIYNSGAYTQVECRDKCLFEVKVFQSLENENSRRCVYFDSEDCAINFEYEYIDNNLDVRVQEERQCPKGVNATIVVGSIAGPIFLIGFILLLIIRGIVWYKDKKECEKWLEEVNRTKLTLEKSDTSMNPFFKSAQTKHMNPIYGKANQD